MNNPFKCFVVCMAGRIGQLMAVCAARRGGSALALAFVVLIMREIAGLLWLRVGKALH